VIVKKKNKVNFWQQTDKFF